MAVKPLPRFTETNGTSYHEETPREVINALEYARQRGHRIRVFYGDSVTGRDWLEEHYTMGTIGRSTGSVKIPLLLNNRRSLGGPAILDHCIVRMVDLTTRRELYQHPNYFQPALAQRGNSVYADGQLIATCSTPEKAAQWVEFMQGKRHSK